MHIFCILCVRHVEWICMSWLAHRTYRIGPRGIKDSPGSSLQHGSSRRIICAEFMHRYFRRQCYNGMTWTLIRAVHPGFKIQLMRDALIALRLGTAGFTPARERPDHPQLSRSLDDCGSHTIFSAQNIGKFGWAGSHPVSNNSLNP